jgi:hypothetical protein
MSAWWDEDHKLLLITPEQLAALPDGEVLTCIDGTTAVKGPDEIDDDTRGGHLAYGVVGCHPLRVAHLEAMAFAPKLPDPVLPDHTMWSCKIGSAGGIKLPRGADAPMRRAVEEAFLRLTGQHAQFNFSGWGSKLDKYEAEVAFPQMPA